MAQIMRLFPALDLQGGRCVRLRQGRFDEATGYSEDPFGIARAFEAAGASALHVVDLDGARAGRPVQLDLVRRIAADVSIPVQLGGGLRSVDDVEAALQAGAARVVLGSALARDPALGSRLSARYGDRVGAAVDALDGGVRVHGWQAEAGLEALQLLDRLCAEGLGFFLCTDIARDGMLCGPAIDWYRELRRAHPNSELLASGGIAALQDIAALREAGLDGAVLGRALYEGRIDLAAALQVAAP
jgi:phosphoribosylformimino-5-aminoimidazole carboxamide ribotide isomerase